MINLTLPKTVDIDGKTHEIRYDFRVIIEIMIMLNDADLTNEEKAEALLTMFYVDPEEITNIRAAVDEAYKFIDGNSDRRAQKGPRLTDWEQDFDFIVSPVNRVLGYECRAVEYDVENNTGGLHWWTFISAYMEIGGDCLFSQIVSIRDKQARGKKLEKYEREWLSRNADLVKIKTKYSDSESELIDAWTKGVEPNG